MPTDDANTEAGAMRLDDGRDEPMVAWAACVPFGVAAAATAAALVVNGSIVGTAFVPALLAFLLWILLNSAYLVRVSFVRESVITRSGPAAAED